MIDKVIGSYKITELIGSGGMGSVYRCVDTMLDRDAAVKVLHPELASQGQVVERFRSEAKVLARLSHPNIATVYTLLEEEGNLFMVLEFVPGKTFEEIMQETGALNLETAADLLTSTLAGVEHAHSLGIVHRDLKPANLILSESGYVKVMDFGIARIVGSDRMTRSGHIVGTLEYMSPEQIKQGEADARSDIYSIGVVLYEMLTGRIPFSAESDFELMKAQLEKVPTAPRDLAPGLPEAVEAVVLKALAKEPDERYQGAAEMRHAIIAALESTGKDGAAAAKKTRLAASAHAPTRLAGSPPDSAKAAAGARSASHALAAKAMSRIRALGLRGGKWSRAAARLPWQYWVIGAAAMTLVAALVFWPRGTGRQQAASESRVASVTEREAAASERDGDGSSTEEAQPREAPRYTESTSPPMPQVPEPGNPELSEPRPFTPAPPPVETEPPTSSPEAQGTDSLRRSPIQRFADNYDEIERLVEEVQAGGKGFQDDYRAYLKSSGKWRPSGTHGTNWDGLEEFLKTVAQFRRDLLEVADETGVIEGGFAKRWARKARIGARDVSQLVSGNKADASLRRLRVLAAEIERQADSLASGVRRAGVSGSINSSWSRLRTKARRVRLLVA